MTNKTVLNKIVYLALIGVIFALTIPYRAFVDSLKQNSDLGEAQIGRVDTGGFILNLALLGGARGIAANILWMDVQSLQKAQEYEKLNSRVELITKLQPHFQTIWTYQGWNLAYNVSVEWDDPRDKYDWIKRGILFLKQGVDKNRKTPDLMWDTGWTYYHKLGFADEAIYLRRLFHEDPDEEFRRYPDSRNNDAPSAAFDDNFKLGLGWFLRAQSLVKDQQESGQSVSLNAANKLNLEYIDAPTQHKGKEGDLAFHCMPSHCATKYAVYLEKESKLGLKPSFGERASIAWLDAHKEWKAFGAIEFLAFNDPEKKKVKLDDVLDENNRKKLTNSQWYWTDRWARQMNYPYWEDRCLAEREPEALSAREKFYEGRLNLKTGDFAKSVQNYSVGLELWKTVVAKHKPLSEDELNKEDLGQIVNYYLRALKQSAQEAPANTPFLELGTLYKNNRSKDPFNLLEVVPDTVYTQLMERFGKQAQN